MTGTRTADIEAIADRLHEYVNEIVKDYRWAEDIAYGTKSGSAGEGGGRRGTGIVGGHSDPTGETATSPEAMRYTCSYIAHGLERMMKQADKYAADLDSRLRQHDDPHARAMRAELAQEARTVTSQEQRAMQDERDRSFSAELRGESEGRKRGRILDGWRSLRDEVSTA